MGTFCIVQEDGVGRILSEDSAVAIIQEGSNKTAVYQDGLVAIDGGTSQDSATSLGGVLQ